LGARQRVTDGFAALLVSAFVVLAVLSIGIYYVPAALALWSTIWLRPTRRSAS
jgi:hypothetical protein